MGSSTGISAPGVANMAEGVRALIRVWVQARRGAVVMNTPRLIPVDHMTAPDEDEVNWVFFFSLDFKWVLTGAFIWIVMLIAKPVEY